MKTRQKVRRIGLALSFALFPVTLYYFSPVISLQAAATGVIGGAAITFGILFLSSLFLGRLFCGWVCPGGAVQELVRGFRGRRAVRRAGVVKWLVWAPWLLTGVLLLLRAGGVRRVDFLYLTRNGVSVTDIQGLMALVIVLVIFVTLALAVGRRGACHTVCWMAPFMILGRKLRNLVGWPALGLEGSPAACVSCGACARTCPMSIDVTARVKSGRVESSDCIYCGTCVDTCPAAAIRYRFGPRR